MCQKVSCEKCGKPTFKGCGKHVEQVLKGVTVSARCHCGVVVETAPVLGPSFFAEAVLTRPGEDLIK
jgi:hypothetical protein